MARKVLVQFDEGEPYFVFNALKHRSADTIRRWAEEAQAMVDAGVVVATADQLKVDIHEALRIADKMDVYKRVYEAMPSDLPHNVRSAAAAAAADRLHNTQAPRLTYDR